MNSADTRQPAATQTSWSRPRVVRTVSGGGYNIVIPLQVKTPVAAAGRYHRGWRPATSADIASTRSLSERDRQPALRAPP